MKIFRLALVVAASAVVVASSASAQSADHRGAGMPRVNLISANPIGLLFEWYNGELEHAFAPTVSGAVAASSFGDFFEDASSDARYSVLDAIGRYYPSARAIRGFSIGLSAGVVDFRDDNQDCFECEDESGTFGTVGIRGDYVWILGRDQRFAVATGIGAKRVFGDGGPGGLPIGRLSIGYAF